ncbi:phage tail protein [Pasteurella multocida]|uniref:phage tail protein n=1 Tax=Pasteurella multocida TaxID=747 RepID=UPI00230130EC|nr:phage tail protein [Pasteurella multocida]MDA5610900.1 phage tail protein [Pasteurella multocida]MDA5613417.1 phage tail protein [Pasteurella multocida]
MGASRNPLPLGRGGCQFDNTPLQASDDSFNFKNVEAQGRIGTQDQEVMEGFNTSEKEIAVSTQVKKLTPITRTITDRKVSRLRLTLGVQSLFHQNDKGDVYGSKVDFTVTIGERSHLVSISGKYSSQYLKQVEFGDLPPVPFQVKVERVNADSKSQRLQNNTIWASYTEIIETQFAYPNTAILGIRFDSEYFSSIPNRTYEIYGIEMKVPSNYDPFERTYTGFWDGTFKIAWTNNPAWILYDLMTNKRYGLGWRLGEFNVDKWALYQAAQYCDQMVPDGFGGQEPRFTCNAWLTDQRKAYDVINDICSIFRAMPVWNGREFTVVMDRPADPVWTYTNANVISGEFSYQYSAQKARHNEIHIEYIDADDSYERKIEVVSDDDLIRRHGLNVKKVTAFACTSRGQAFRTGKWILETERLETKTVTFAVGAEGLMHIPGDIIRVADCDYADTNIGGRVLDINGNKVTLDREIEINGNSHLTYIDGEAKHKDIRIVSKNGKEVMLESEPVGLAELGVWSLTTQEINVQLFRALTINEEEQGQYTIIALQHEPQKEAIVDNGAVFEPRETTLSTAGLDKVSHVNVQANGDGVALSFDYVVKHSAMVKYQIKLYKAGTFYKIFDDLTSPNYKFTGLPDGEYTAEIRAKNEQGQLSEAVTKSFNISFVVSELTTVSKVFGILLQWKNPVFANPNSAIEIWTSTDNQFENARKLVSLSYPTSEYSFSGLGVNEKHYFWVRMIDTANGNAGEFTKSVVGTSEKSGKKLVEYIQGQVTKSTLAKDLAQEITQIQATASEATDSAKMALSRIDSEATTRAEQIKQEGESIKASVRKEYEKNASAISNLEKTTQDHALQISTVHSKFNQLQIGGRNLLKHSEKLNKNWGKNGGVTLDTDHGIATLTANGRLVALSQVLIEDQVEVKDGKVVLSFDALSNKSGKLNLRLRRYTGSTHSDISAYVTVDSRDYKRYSVVFDYQKSEGQTRLSVEIVTYEKDGTVFNIKKPKLELGNIATDWTPAPEDVDSTLSEVNASISSLKNTTAEKEKAFSQEVSTVKAEIVGAKALITSSSQAISSLDGKVQSMYTLKTETVAGGRKAIAGIALGADGQTAESQVIIFANKFAIADPNSNALKTPFVISTHNGRSQVALAGDLIVDDSITGDKIQANTTITSPKIEGGHIKGNTFEGGVIRGARIEGLTGKFTGELEVTQIVGGNVLEVFTCTSTHIGASGATNYGESPRYHIRYMRKIVKVLINSANVDRELFIIDPLSSISGRAYTSIFRRPGRRADDNDYTVSETIFMPGIRNLQARLTLPNGVINEYQRTISIPRNETCAIDISYETLSDTSVNEDTFTFIAVVKSTSSKTISKV